MLRHIPAFLTNMTNIGLPTQTDTSTMTVQLSTFANGDWQKFLLKWNMKHVKRGVVPMPLKMHIFREQCGLCAFCKKHIFMDPADFDCDHIIPVKYGGPTCRSNIQLLCVRCHRKKAGLERRKSGDCKPSIILCTSGDAVRVSPMDIADLVKTSVGGTFCLEYGDLNTNFARTGRKKRALVTDAIREKQKQNRIASREILEKVDVTKMGKETYNILLNRKIEGRATMEDLAKMQKYSVQIHYSQEVGAAFVKEFNDKARAIHNRIRMDTLNTTVQRNVHAIGILKERQVNAIRGDELAIPKILQTLKAMGYYTGWDDRTTMVNFAALSMPVGNMLYDTLEFTKSIFMERESDGKSTAQRLSGYMKKIVGYQLLRKQIGKAKVAHYVIRDH